MVGVEAGSQPEARTPQGPCLPFLRLDFVLKAAGRRGFSTGLEWCEARQRAMVIIQRKVKT